MSEYNNSRRRDDRYHDAESHRSRRREEDRRKRGDDDDNDKDESTSKKTKYELERQARMTKLREEMKQEDEELEAIERKAEEPEAPKPQETIIEYTQEDLEGLDEKEQMRKLLGFGGFGSTKGEAVEDNQKSASKGVAQKNKARKYRQYMNRKNGFNRPLEKMN